MIDTLFTPRELSFQLFEVLGTLSLLERPRFAEHRRETFEAVLSSARRIATETFAPHFRKADEEEPRVEGGRVVLPPEVKRAFDAFAEAGFLSAHHDAEQGGMQLPYVVLQAAVALFQGANAATTSYSLLTLAAANVLAAFGSEAQKQRYLPAMLAGRYAGTMALTEPQAGSSLADLRTTAEPRGDGSYSIRGTKIFISGGDQDLTENIVHLVLARLPGAPDGVRGISLFVVPKLRPADTGEALVPNDVALAGLIHKMGWRGTTSTHLSFGENGDCRGWLVGEPHQGLGYMFRMMNEARIGVGLVAAAQGYAAFRYALDYARTRRQGRSVAAKDASTPPLPIVAHADVRRMLLAQKAFAEGALSLCLYCSSLVDDQESLADGSARDDARLVLDVLTPIAKAWSAKYNAEAADLAIQVLGGYGYTRDYPVEQYYRDSRLNPIHEGTHGVQALDLLGRKVMLQEGRGAALLLKAIAATVELSSSVPALSDLTTAVRDGAQLLATVTQTLVKGFRTHGPERVLANASAYLELAGRVVVAWTWLRQALAAEAALRAGGNAEDAAFYQGKLQAARYYVGWELPKARLEAELLTRFDDVCLAMQDGWY